MSWEQIYDLLGIRQFVYFISSPEIQERLLPVKAVFIIFSLFFLGTIIYFFINSSWLKYRLTEDIVEFLSWQPYGIVQITKRWNKILKRIDSGLESEYKLAVIEAEDFLNDVLERAGYEGESFEERIKKVEKKLGSLFKEVLSVHEIRNSIVYNPDFKLSLDLTQKVLEVYKKAVDTIGV